MLTKIWEFSKEMGKRTVDKDRTNHYRRAALITIPLTLILFVVYICLGCLDDLSYAKWFQNLIPIPGFFGHLLSSTTYIGSALDLRHNKEREPAFWATTTGIVCGLTVGVILSYLLHVPLGFTGILTSSIFIMRCISSYAGLFSRCTAIFTHIKTRREGKAPERELREIILLAAGLLMGLILGTYLFVTDSAKMINLLGVINFFTPGLSALLTVSPVIGCIVFISMFTSAMMSSQDYFSKGYTYLYEMLNQNSHEPKIQKFHEYRGSFFGGLLSFGVGTILVCAHVHFLSLGFLEVTKAIGIFATCFSVVGGIWSRLGLTFDGLFKPEDSLPKKAAIVVFTALSFTGIAALVYPIFYSKPSPAQSKKQKAEIPTLSRNSRPSLLIQTSPSPRSGPSPKTSSSDSLDEEPILRDRRSASALRTHSLLSPKPSSAVNQSIVTYPTLSRCTII